MLNPKRAKTFLMLFAALMIPLQPAWAGKGKDKKKQKDRSVVSWYQPQTAEALAPTSEEDNNGTAEITAAECSDLLTTPPAPALEKWDSLSVKEQYEVLLVMIANSYLPKFVAKDLMENAEFSLGIPLQNQRTLGLDYVYDTRFSEVGELHLSRIKVVDRFGNTTTILKDALDPNGNLRPIKMTEAIAPEEYAAASFPRVIEGELMQKILASKGWLESASRERIRASSAAGLSGAKLMKVKIMAHLSQIWNWGRKDVKQHVLRYMMIGGIVLGVPFLIASLTPGKTVVVNNSHYFPLAISDNKSTDQQQLTLTMTHIQESQTIDSAEKELLLQQLNNNNGRNAIAIANSLQNMEGSILSADVPGAVWIYQKTGQLYISNIGLTSEAGIADVKFGGIVEIPQSLMPKTYATVMQLLKQGSQPAAQQLQPTETVVFVETPPAGIVPAPPAGP